jgi:PAS domain S-box-containing protein
MLRQLRTLFMITCLVIPVTGLWNLHSPTRTGIVLATTVALQAWLYVCYRRRIFPAWSWLLEGGAVFVLAWVSDYGAPGHLLFFWVNLRGLYGGIRDKVLGAGVVTVILAAGIPLAGVDALTTLQSVATAMAVLAVSYTLANSARNGERSALRGRTVAGAGARLAAATTRAEAMQVAVQAAAGMTDDAAAMIATINGASLRVAARASQSGPGNALAHRSVTDELWSPIDALPVAARAVLAGGEPVRLRGADAMALAAAVGLRPAGHAVLAPMAMEGKVFGVLAVVSDEGTDDLSSTLTTLADEVALTLDNLLIRSRLGVVVEHSPDALILASDRGTVRFVNPVAQHLLGMDGAELVGSDVHTLLNVADLTSVLPTPVETGRQPVRCRIPNADGGWTDVDVVAEQVTEHDGSQSLVLYARDVSDQERLELELRHAQKLESVGRLAAGIAHEINTPVQFIGDNVRFLRDAFADLQRLCAAYATLADAVGTGADTAGPMRHVEQVAADADVDFILEEVPAATSQTLEGVARVAKIVHAMKAFGHPGSEEKAHADINQAITNTLVVANNEVKYVADVELDLAELPPVLCHLGDINQVILNLVVNAAHAIAAADRGRGTIRISTRMSDGQALIEVADSGTGIPAAIADKVFDPFFTTKEVGTGTGQGLSLVRTLVVERHGGVIGFTTEPDVGTTFTVRLPLSAGGDTARDPADPADPAQLLVGAAR